MVSIDFRYKDKLSQWEWREQHCYVSSLEECIKIYGLGVDCEYEIINIAEDKSSEEGALIKCPSCKSYFRYDLSNISIGETYKCACKKCGFLISEKKIS